jgi:hypothetical protein
MAGYRFMPLPEILDTIWRTSDDAWNVDVDRSEHVKFGGGYGLGLEIYNPRWARFENLDHQTARLRRGNRVLLVSKPAAEVAQSELGYALFTNVGESEEPPRHDHARVDDAGRGIFLVEIPPDPQLLALESWTDGLARRTRFGTGELDALLDARSISDLLLFDGRASDSPRLDDVLDPMTSSLSLRADTVGLFWEVYGLRRGERRAMRLSIDRPPPTGIAGFLSRLPLIGGRAPAPEVRWTFTAEPDDDGIQSFAVDVPLAGLEPGAYILTVSCECGGAEAVVAKRTITVLGG